MNDQEKELTDELNNALRLLIEAIEKIATALLKFQKLKGVDDDYREKNPTS